MDVLARTTMKGAAKCDKHCELQISVNKQGFERKLRFRDTPESMPASLSNLLVLLASSFIWWLKLCQPRVCASKRVHATQRCTLLMREVYVCSLDAATH